MQSGPANELHFATSQVKILGQNGLNFLVLSAVIHCLTEFNDATEFIVAEILRVGQDGLRVVLGGHGSTLRPVDRLDCELLLSLRNETSLLIVSC